MHPDGGGPSELMLASTAVGSPIHAPFASAFVNAGPNFVSSFMMHALSAVGSGLAASLDRQFNHPDSFLDAAFSFEPAHLRSGSLPAVAFRGAAKTRAHSGRSKTRFFIIVDCPFV